MLRIERNFDDLLIVSFDRYRDGTAYLVVARKTSERVEVIKTYAEVEAYKLYYLLTGTDMNPETGYLRKPLIVYCVKEENTDVTEQD